MGKDSSLVRLPRCAAEGKREVILEFNNITSLH